MTKASSVRRQPRSVSFELDSPELAATYDEVGVRQFNHGKLLIAALALAPGERVLDIGCGTGLLGAYVATLVSPDGEVVGIDPLPLRVALAAKKNPRFKTSVGRAEDLSAFPAESFDAAYLNSVFHWVPDADKVRALREVLRVLKPGGRIGVNSADADRPHQSVVLVQEASRAAGLPERATGGLENNQRVSASELEQLLQEAGFEAANVVSHTFVDDVRDVDDLLRWSSSSSFGNFLSDLAADERTRVRSELQRALESRRSAAGLTLERYLVFGTARKPRG